MADNCHPWIATFDMTLRQNLKDHIALTVLEDVDGFLVAETLEADRVDG